MGNGTGVPASSSAAFAAPSEDAFSASCPNGCWLCQSVTARHYGNGQWEIALVVAMHERGACH